MLFRSLISFSSFIPSSRAEAVHLALVVVLRAGLVALGIAAFRQRELGLVRRN